MLWNRFLSEGGQGEEGVVKKTSVIIDHLTADVKKPFRLDSNLLRIDDTSIHKSLRECLANALIHADFHGRRGIVVDKEFCPGLILLCGYTSFLLKNGAPALRMALRYLLQQQF